MHETVFKFFESEVKKEFLEELKKIINNPRKIHKFKVGNWTYLVVLNKYKREELEMYHGDVYWEIYLCIITSGD